MNAFRMCFCLALVVLLFTIGCSTNPASWPSGQPLPPSDPLPADGGQAYAGGCRIAWEATPGFAGTFTLYFGKSPDPSLLASGLTTNAYRSGSLESNTTYYWRVLAIDTSGRRTSSPRWSFTTVAEDGGYRFPLAVGNRWSYRGRIVHTNFRPPELQREFPDPITVEIETMITGTMVMENGETGYILGNVSHYDDNQPVSIRTILVNREDGLYEYQVRKDPPSDGAPSGTTHHEHWKNLTIAHRARSQPHPQSLWSDSIWYGEAYKRLSYPMSVGSQWEYASSLNGQWRVDKEVTDRTSIHVGIGRFDCWEISTTYTTGAPPELEESIFHQEYVSSIGKVSETSVIRDLQIVTYSTEPGTSGLVDIVYSWELVDYEVEQ